MIALGRVPLSLVLAIASPNPHYSVFCEPTTKTPLSKSSRTERPRYHLGWSETPPLCHHRRRKASERARPDHGGLSRPALSTNIQTFSGFGGNSGVASARACWSSSHFPRLAGCLARRVLFTVNVVRSFIVDGTVPCDLAICQSVESLARHRDTETNDHQCGRGDPRDRPCVSSYYDTRKLLWHHA